MIIKALNLADGDLYVNADGQRFVVSEVAVHTGIGPDSCTVVACRLRPEWQKEAPGWRDAFNADNEITVISPPELFRETP